MRYIGFGLVVGSVTYLLGNHFLGWFDSRLMGYDATIICAVAFVLGGIIIFATPKVGP